MRTGRPWCRIAGANGCLSTTRSEMPLQTFFTPEHIFQTIAVALSIFNLVTFLWLALTVWLNGDRHSWIARIGVVGLALSALFFYIHALLIFEPLNATAQAVITPDFLWHLIW